MLAHLDLLVQHGGQQLVGLAGSRKFAQRLNLLGCAQGLEGWQAAAHPTEASTPRVQLLLPTHRLQQIHRRVDGAGVGVSVGEGTWVELGVTCVRKEEGLRSGLRSAALGLCM